MECGVPQRTSSTAHVLVAGDRHAGSCSRVGMNESRCICMLDVGAPSIVSVSHETHLTRLNKRPHPHTANRAMDTPSLRPPPVARTCSQDTILIPELLGSRHRDILHGIEPSSRGGKRLALRFRADGDVAYEEFTRVDVFRMVEAKLALVKKQEECAIAPEAITLAKRRHSFAGSSDVPVLHMRDIRKLDSMFSISNEPSLFVRKQVILVNLEPIRAVILHDVCLIFLPDGADSLISMLKQAFKDPLDSIDHAFEFKAMEAILATLTKIVGNDCQKVLPVAQTTLDMIAKQAQSAQLEMLRKLKNVMSELSAQVNGIRRVLVNTLEDETTLHSFYLTKLFETPQPLRSEPDTWNYESDYVESMLESYLQEFYGQLTKIELVLSNIQNTESIVMMKLDTMRNSLLTVDLSLTCVTAFLTVATFITGGFGMNLNSTIQDVLGIFWIVFGTLLVFPFCMYHITAKYLRKRGINLLGYNASV
ncbi:Aste57867_18189 [Aphanomyces stellatus]|uniref:Magnesium transporter n=1 Tax=Aphanomyces stellatus TaxID=120398 RepID=A0A485L9F9_9STRA|nr:hypothetical protein As57867_018127 [Aphanomyces stellatus]VFT94927.1 Aste57867_18189 [Aphanomyces stellatus]